MLERSGQINADHREIFAAATVLRGMNICQMYALFIQEQAKILAVVAYSKTRDGIQVLNIIIKDLIV